jgi:hypothetical protein
LLAKFSENCFNGFLIGFHLTNFGEFTLGDVSRWLDEPFSVFPKLKVVIVLVSVMGLASSDIAWPFAFESASFRGDFVGNDGNKIFTSG